jgi:hypothetical protein
VWDPNGERTIGISLSVVLLMTGVLTKADTVEEGNFDQWLSIVNGQTHYLRLGYFMTRLAGPTNKEAEKSCAEIREAERQYFKNKKGPWANEADDSRLGTDKLIDALSEALARMIDER